MGILECASGASAWRGYDYYKNKKVMKVKEIEENVFNSIVAGSSGETYSVELHINHPRKSKCNCPHADGRRIICKHIVATYFHVLPQEATRFYDEVISYQEEEEERQEQLYDRVFDYVMKMKKAELCSTVLDLLYEGPEWQYERFIREHGIEDEYDRIVAEEAYDEYAKSGKKSRPVDALWKELDY